MTAHNGVDPPRSKPVFTPTRATTSLTTSLHVPGHTHLTTVGQELNRLAPSSCCRHRRPMGVRGRRAPTAQPSRVGKALPLFFGGTVARRLADRNPLTTTWSSSPDERLMVKLPISTCPLSTSLGRFDWRWRLLLTSGIIWLPEYFREAAPSRRLTKIQISLLQLRLPSDPRRSFLAAARHAFSERGIQNNRAEGRGDHTRSAGGVPLRGHKGSSKGSEQDAAQATCTLAACARRVALSLPFFA